MEVILLEKIQHLGNLGDKVKVKPGFARNFLIPQGRAVSATPTNIAKFEARRAELEQHQADALAAAQARAQALGGVVVTIAKKAGDEGRLFGSVSAQDIVDAVAETGVEIKKNEVRLPEGPLRQIGEYQVGIHFHADVAAAVTVNVITEN